MDVARPYAAVAPTVDGDVLVALAGSRMPLTGRDVTRIVGRRSSSAVAASLDRLVQHGLVHRQQAGRSYLHTLNREHLAAEAIEVLAGMRMGLRRRMRERLEGWKPAAVHLSMFGSAARGDGDLRSDIDLFLIRRDEVDVDEPPWRKQVDDLVIAIEEWTGNAAEIHELARGELTGFVREAPPLLDELRDDAADVYGSRLHELLKEAGE